MKKLIAVLLCVCLCVTAFCCSVYAVPLASGTDALKAEFNAGSGGGLDYRYFAPQTAPDRKYPLVIWLHGIASGNYDGNQIDSYDICKWVSDEYQSRFADAGGAFVLAPRCADGWNQTTPATLKSCVESLIAQFPDAIDPDRIYLCGFSAGASMVLRTAAIYPNYFAAAVPLSAVGQNASQVKALRNMAVWFFANEQDTYASANVAATRKSFNTLKSVATDKSRIRFTAMSMAVTPSGGEVSTQHYMWHIFTNDMFMEDGSPYANSTTVDGTGTTISFSYPDGIISWLSRQVRREAEQTTQRKTFLDLIANFIKMIIHFFKNLF